MKPEQPQPFGTVMLPSLRKRVRAYCKQHGIHVWNFIQQAVTAQLDKESS